MTPADPPHDPRKRPRQARSRALVDAILDAAARILAEHGRESLTTNAIAVKAGVSIGSLYQYFPNRDAILAAVAERHAHRIYHHVADVELAHETTLEAAITRIVGGLFAAHRIDPALHAALDGDLVQHSGSAHHHHGHHQHHHGGTKTAMAVLLRGLPNAARMEIKRSDVDLAAVTVAEIVHAMAHAAIVHPHDDRTPDVFEREAVIAALSYLRATLSSRDDVMKSTNELVDEAENTALTR